MEVMNLQNRKHWIFKKHTNNIDVLIDVATYLKDQKSDISSDEKKRMFNTLKQNSVYKPRKSTRNMPLDSINHRIDELSYYMFGYSKKIENKKKFIFSPLGNLFLNHINDKEKTSKIFATMLAGIQFPHPASLPSEDFELYPFRLIFKLLLDSRLEGKLYNYEIYQHLIYLDRINPEIYERLIQDILDSRKLSDEEKFIKVKSQEDIIVKSVYEWEYYVLKLLCSQGIFISQSGDVLGKVYHPTKNPNTVKTGRKVTNSSFELNREIKEYISRLTEEYTIYDAVLSLDNDSMIRSDIIKEIYSFYPDLLLDELSLSSDGIDNEIIKLPKLIEKYSLNENGETFNQFEDILEEAFNLFYNVEAERVSGPGRTDIECMYLEIREKFAVDAKSTSKKLPGINAGRLARHRRLIGAKYTIVITPRYVPSVKYDIDGQEIVIIKANTFAEYIYNYLATGIREIDFGELREIILSHMGKDISLQVSEQTLSKFG